MEVIKNLVSSAKYDIKCPYIMNPEYTMPSIGGTYNLKTKYYLANKFVCQTEDRYIKIV